MDWSNLQADYERLGSQRAVAEFYGTTRRVVEKAMARLDIPCKPRAGRKVEWSDERRAKHKAACNTDAFKEAHRVSLVERLADMRSSATDSPLEKLLHGALKRAGLSFSTQRGLLGRYVADILIVQGDARVVVEADGFGHRFPDRKAKDQKRDADLTAAGYRVFRFDGTAINADPDGCIAHVMREASLKRDAEPVADVRRGGKGKENPNWKGAQVEHTCSHCGGTFVQYGVNRTYDRKFCNQKCYGAWMKANPSANPVLTRWARARQSQQVVT